MNIPGAKAYLPLFVWAALFVCRHQGLRAAAQELGLSVAETRRLFAGLTRSNPDSYWDWLAADPDRHAAFEALADAPLALAPGAGDSPRA